MAAVQLSHICRYFGSRAVLDDVSLEVRDSEFVVIVGPSGCGKSTLLRSIAGFEYPDRGDVLIGGRRVNDIPPGRRHVAMVFQNYALYPHMTAAGNLGFCLANLGLPRAQIERRVREVAQVLRIEPLLGRRPHQMSGGQRQRVAIGRAIIRSPGVYLFDEPLSNLDALLRVQMRIELAELHQRYRTTTVYVTHDQVEAMTLAARIVVMNEGRVEQTGNPLDVYHQPANIFVAGFLGSPPMNFFPGSMNSCDGEKATIRITEGVQLEAAVDAFRVRANDPVTAGVRPEDVGIDRTGKGPRVRVNVIERLGSRTLLYCTLSGSKEDVQVVIEQPGKGASSDAAEPGQMLCLAIRPRDVQVFTEDGRALARRHLRGEL